MDTKTSKTPSNARIWSTSQEDGYVSRVAKTTTDVCQLVDAGFEFVCEVEDNKIFRKRK